MKHFALVLLSFFLLGSTYALPDNPFKEVDEHARKLNKLSTFERTAERLTEPFPTEAEKARAIFTWITDRIRYDIDKFKEQLKNPKQRKITFDASKSLEEVKQQRQMAMARTAFKRERGVCEDYAYLFQYMCEHVGLEAVFIPGFGRNSFKDINRIHEYSNHAWNAVKIDGNWYLLDATWAAGNTDMHAGIFTKSFKSGFFMTPPQLFALSHFPDDEKWQLLKEPLSKAEFAAQPYPFHELLEPAILDYFPRNGLLDRDLNEIVLGLELKDRDQRFVLIHNRKMTHYQPEMEEAQILFRIPSAKFRKGELTIAVIKGKKAKPVISYHLN